MTTTLGILGGSFDPVHNGHVIAATFAIEALALDRLVVVPAHRSPHKRDDPVAPPEVRLAMLRAAFADVPRAEVSDLELQRPPPSYTVDTLRALGSLHPGAILVLLLGADAVRDLPRWRAADAVVRACRVAVFRRPGYDAAILDRIRVELPGLDAVIVDVPAIDISASTVRSRARGGLSLAGFVPDAVRAEIRRRNLYTR